MKLERPVPNRKQLKTSVRHLRLLAFGAIVSTVMVSFALMEVQVSWIWDSKQAAVWCIADKMCSVFSGEFLTSIQLQQRLLHTCCFSCQNWEVSMFLLLVMGAGKGKCIIYTNAYNKAVWKHSKWLCFLLFLSEKSVIINIFSHSLK